MIRLRDVWEEFFDMLNAPFTYWLALPPEIGVAVVLVTLALLAVDEIREARA